MNLDDYDARIAALAEERNHRFGAYLSAVRRVHELHDELLRNGATGTATVPVVGSLRNALGRLEERAQLLDAATAALFRAQNGRRRAIDRSYREGTHNT